MKYYKITNEEENHHGLQYKDGVVEDIWPFNPSGNCMPGGIYFASKDILAFLSYGVWIREVTPIGKIYENPGSPKKYKAHKIKLGRRRKITLNVIKKLVKEGANIHAGDEAALCLAAEDGDLKIVKYLVENGADVNILSGWPLCNAANFGHVDVVKYLVEQGADISTDNYCAFCWAAEFGNLDVVRFLLEQGADIHSKNDYALCYAAYNGHFDMVKFLVENGADTYIDNEMPFRMAVGKNYTEIVDYLKSIMEEEK
jgi:hypothetical protein